MRQYELILIVQPDLDEETTNGVIDRVKTMITDHDGKILKADIWGSRQMAYMIQKFRDGFYVYIEAEFTPEYGIELTKALRYIEPIIRYSLIKKED